MKANRASRLALAATIAALLASCSGQRQVVPAPRPTVAPRPQLAPAPSPPRNVQWRDMPATPGNWRWSMEGSRSVARFGNNAFVLSCNRDAGAISLIRPGTALGPVPMTILTASGNRTLSAEGVAGPPPAIALSLPARDPILDAMAFSRGRFAIETAGLPTLYLPSWPEISRVIEDCR